MEKPKKTINEIVCWWSTKRRAQGLPEALRDKYLDKYKKIEESGLCPFCPDGLEKSSMEVVHRAKEWTVVKNQYPYPGTKLHLLLFPNRHIVSCLEIREKEWQEFRKILKKLSKNYPFLENGFGVAMREKELGGATLYHLHWHLIVPEVNVENNLRVPVNFGIG